MSHTRVPFEHMKEENDVTLGVVSLGIDLYARGNRRTTRRELSKTIGLFNFDHSFQYYANHPPFS